MTVPTWYSRSRIAS